MGVECPKVVGVKESLMCASRVVPKVWVSP